jgi:hypothetical protein
VRGMAAAMVVFMMAWSGAGDAVGQTFDWINTSGGNYAIPGNWNPSGPPGSTATVRFTQPNTYSVSFSTSATANVLNVCRGQFP